MVKPVLSIAMSNHPGTHVLADTVEFAKRCVPEPGALHAVSSAPGCAAMRAFRRTRSA